jgi:NADP-dependent 3-hydroxy acid dehydrogenase YdfG
MSNKPLVAITGASSGIGAATAKLLSEKGHPLLLMARRVDKMHQLNLPNTVICKVDVTDLASLENAVKEAEAKFGPVDLLVNNSGLMQLGQVAVQDPKEWKNMYDVNCLGLLNGIHAVLPGMIARKSGTIINISSVAGRKTFANHTAYVGTKFAVHAMSENLREEVSGSGVRVIVIAPGAVETELLSHTTDSDIKAGYQSWKDSMADGKVLEPQDVASAIDYAYSAPQRVCIREIVLAATSQGA